MVGRERELAALEALLESGSEGSCVVFIRGEGGVGKTRLASELADRAAGRDWNVIRGRAYPVESGVPYAIFADAWLPTMQSLDPSALTVLSRGGETELRYLFPALRGGRNDPDDLAVSDPEEFRTRLMWNFAEFVKRYASRTPILCVLEDLQWADDSSLQLIHFLARQSQGQPILILCTYNDQHRDQCPRLVQTERSLESMGVGEVLRLDPLTLEDVTNLVRMTFSVDVDLIREFSPVLFGWTRGNAFFVEEILKSLISSGQIREESGTWVGWDARDFKMPESIRDAIIGHVEALSEAGRALADLVAVIGGRASYTLLRSISGLEADQALSALEELCADGVLSEDSDDGHVVYGFRHPLVSQTLYDEFGLQRARILHGVVAEAMEEYYGTRAVDHADELAFHFSRTDGGKLREKATKYLALAGRKALDRRADLEAINYLEAALERAREEGAAGSETLTELVPLLARAHTHVGHFDTAAQLWASALDHVDQGSPEYLALRRALGMTNVWRGRHEEASRHFEAGLEASRAADDARATVRLLIAQANGRHELGLGTEALDILAEALPLAETIGDPDLLARVHRALTLLHVWVGPPAKAIEHGERSIELAKQVGSLSTEFWARWGLAVLAGMRGDTDRMAHGIDDLNDIADRARSPVLRLWTAEMSVELAFGQGQWDTGVARGEQAISLARTLNQRTLLPRLLVLTSQFYVARDELDRAQDLIDEAVQMSGLNDDFGSIDVHQVVPTYIGLAHYLVALGDYEDAIDAAEKGLQIAEGTGYILWATHRLLPILGEACLWAGHIDRAEQVGARIREYSERIDHKIGNAWADACAGFVQWKRGDAAGAVNLMKASVEALEAIPQIWPATRIRRQLAGRLFEIGRRDEALLELDRVHEVCVRVRAGLELEKTRGMYREMGVRPPPIATDGRPLGLTPTELQVAILVAGGRTNEEIAKKSQRRTRTISTHLSNIYTKLGIGGAGARVRLGNLVREAGLLE
ncbi:MAG: AAA family ATPase [Gemmatimonadetes bacterium]|nr:AAA family ATPase [Gemmatimonadota bacterium]